MLDATNAAAVTTAAATTAATTATADAAAAADATTTAQTTAPPASDAAAGAAAIGIEPASLIAILTQLVEVLNQLVSLLMQQGAMGGGPGQKGPFGEPAQHGGFPGQSHVGGAAGGVTQGGTPGQGPGQTTQVGGASGAPGQAPVSAPLMKPLHWFPRAGEQGAKEARAESSSGSIVTVVRGADGGYRLANPTGRGETVAIDGTFAHFDANGRFVQTGAVNGQRMGIVDRSNAVQVLYGSQVDTSKPIGQVSTTPVFLKASAVDASKPIGQAASNVTPVFIRSTGVATTQQTTTPVFLRSSGVNTNAPLGSSSGSTNVIVSNYSNASTTGVDAAADTSTAAASPGANVPPGQVDGGGGDHVAPPAPTGLGAGLPG